MRYPCVNVNKKMRFYCVHLSVENLRERPRPGTAIRQATTDALARRRHACENEATLLSLRPIIVVLLVLIIFFVLRRSFRK